MCVCVCVCVCVTHTPTPSRTRALSQPLPTPYLSTSQMKAQHKMPNQVFSLCFMKGGGMMTIGGSDSKIHTDEMVLVPTSHSTGQGEG